VNIVAADWLPYRLPLRQPWRTSRGELSERTGRLLRLRTDAGLTGWGDCAPLPEFGIDEAAAIALADETARLDLDAQAAGCSLAEWLGGVAPPASVAVNAVPGAISTLDEWALHEAIAAGFTIVKLKAGVAPPAAELARLQEICARLPAGVRLRLDANGAWDVDDAAAFVAGCRALPVDGIEEPLRAPTAAALRALQDAAPFPLALDESLHLLDEDFWRSPPVRRLVIKPGRLGGLRASVEIARRAGAAGIECVVTSALESACGLTALAHLAAAIAPEACHGLATAGLFATDAGQPPELTGGRMRIPTEPGLGFASTAVA
jgi:O-succinylbenzoate synthase